MSYEETSKGEEEVQGKGRGGRKMGRGRSLSVQQSREQKSLDGTLKSDWSKRESTLIESAEAEGNPRDILNSRIEELEQQLREVEDRYSGLTKEARETRELCEAERHDCEDIVFVAKRNLRRLVERILEGQNRRRELGRTIEKADEDARKEQWRRSQQRALEEERLTRNVVLLQTKLLIVESKRFERDRLLKKIREAEEEVTSLDKRHEEALDKARSEIKVKYESLHSDLVSRVRTVSEGVWDLSRAQQFAALGERQRSIVKTQARYRKAVQLALRLRDKKSVLREERSILHREKDVEASLADALAAKAEIAREDLFSAKERFEQDKEQQESVKPQENLQEEFETIIKELEDEVFKKKDRKVELELILADQESYLKSLEEERVKRKLLHEKLSSMAKVAEMVLGKGALAEEPKASTPDISERTDFLEKMSTILLEVAEGTAKFCEPQSPSGSSDSSLTRPPYARGVLGLVPKEGIRVLREGSAKSRSPATSSGLQLGQPTEGAKKNDGIIHSHLRLKTLDNR
ncbi:uncharacterized protein NPIL_117941 [Nephila pilipes]|uniref:Uncharacterized protein n=1 Tax=Nephila pilipes TaxID=299642 RepID=A0A8X6NC48_NEPPI|nr:uncharacterized protein NPIL_117941 [Nephila pilipes]